MNLIRIGIAAAVFLGLVAASGCNGHGNGGDAAASALDHTGLTPLQVGKHRVWVEAVATEATRGQGLMYRRHLPEDHGMIFVYAAARPLSFYMANTLVPLSIAFLREDGTINDIHDMRPLDRTSIPSEGAAKYALEVNQGWYERHGVRPGDRVELPESIRSLPADP